MKKSELYKMASYAVMHCNQITGCEKLDVLKVLIEDRDLAIWREMNEEEEKNG